MVVDLSFVIYATKYKEEDFVRKMRDFVKQVGGKMLDQLNINA